MKSTIIVMFAFFLSFNQLYPQIVLDGRDNDWQHEPVLVEWINNTDGLFPESVCAAVADCVDIKEVKAKIINNTLYVFFRMWGGPAWPAEREREYNGRLYTRARGYYTICLDLDDNPASGWDCAFYETHYTPVGYLADQGLDYRTIGAEASITVGWKYYYAYENEGRGGVQYIYHSAEDCSEYDGVSDNDLTFCIAEFEVPDPDSAKALLWDGRLKILYSFDPVLWADTLRSFYMGHAWSWSEDRSQDDFLEFAHELTPMKEYWGRKGFDYLQPGQTIGICAFVETPVDYWGIDMTPRGELIVPEQINETGPIELSIDSLLYAGQGFRFLVPVHVKFPDDSLFSSAEIRLGGFQDNAEFVDVVTYSSLSGDADWTVVANNSENIVKVAMAGANDIGGSGVLFWLDLRVLDSCSGFVPITIESALFNTATMAVQTSFGGLFVLPARYGDVDLNEGIQAFDAALILKYLVGQVDLTAQQLVNANVSSRGTVTNHDATIILQYVAGSIKTLPVFPGDPAFMASGAVHMPDRLVKAEEYIEIPMSLSNGENIHSFYQEIAFDDHFLTFENIIWSPMLDNFAVTVQEDHGILKVAAASTKAMRSEGLFATLSFKVKNVPGGQSTVIGLQKLYWNEKEILENLPQSTVSVLTSADEKSSNLPDSFDLLQNFPNPFNPSTRIEFHMPARDQVSLTVYNVQGQQIRVLKNGDFSAGRHAVQWNGTDSSGREVAAGIYFVRLTSDGRTKIIKMLLTR